MVCEHNRARGVLHYAYMIIKHRHVQTHGKVRPHKPGACTDRESCVLQVNLHVDFTQVQRDRMSKLIAEHRSWWAKYKTCSTVIQLMLALQVVHLQCLRRGVLYPPPVSLAYTGMPPDDDSDSD
jgi:hypothetical protein